MNQDNTIEILLVEDNPQDVELTVRALKKYRLANNIRVARDGAEALDYLRGEAVNCRAGHGPHLVLLDLKLPKVDGLEVLRAIRGDAKTACLPVVVLTSSAEERDLVESYRLGVNSYIVKPVDFDKFVEVVAELGLYWLLINKSPFRV